MSNEECQWDETASTVYDHHRFGVKCGHASATHGRLYIDARNRGHRSDLAGQSFNAADLTLARTGKSRGVRLKLQEAGDYHTYPHTHCRDESASGFVSKQDGGCRGPHGQHGQCRTDRDQFAFA